MQVRNNELVGLPVLLNLLTALQVLDASMNRLAWLPSLKGMTRVTQLQLSCAHSAPQFHFVMSSDIVDEQVQLSENCSFFCISIGQFELNMRRAQHAEAVATRDF